MSDCSFKIHKPEGVFFTLKMTLSLREWQQIRKELASSPSYAPRMLRDEIGDMVQQAEKCFTPRPKPPGESE